jgi:hypothetical protein
VGSSGGPAGPGWMLSVRRRQEDARGGAGGVGQLRPMDNDAELEEGEACGDVTTFVDPDVALSYIVSRLASSRQFRACYQYPAIRPPKLAACSYSRRRSQSHTEVASGKYSHRALVSARPSSCLLGSLAQEAVGQLDHL